MTTAFLIAAKDLRLRARDRSVFLFAFVVPLGLAFLFSAILPGGEDLGVRAAVADLDDSPVTASFTDDVLPAVGEAGVLQLGSPLASREAAEEAIRAGELDVAWVLPAGFGDGVTQGAGGDVEVLVSADAPVAGEVARGVAATWTDRLQVTALAVATAEVVGAEVDPAELGASVASREPALALTSLDAPDRQLDATSYLAAGMAAFFVFFTVQYGVTGLLEERQLGTLPRLLAAPIAPWAVQAGKVLGAALLGVVSMAVLAVASRLLLGADWGPPAGVALLVLAMVVAATGLMALVGTVARTAEQAGNYQSIVAIVLGMLGGVFVPLPTSGLLATVAAASPHGWFLRGIADQTATGAWTDALPAAGAIALFGVVAAVPAVFRMRRAVAR